MLPTSGCSSTPFTLIYLFDLDVSVATRQTPLESLPGRSESKWNVPRKLYPLIQNLWLLWGMACLVRESAAG